MTDTQFCTNCGTKLEPGDVFCMSCGTPVDDEASTSPAEQTRPAAPQPAATQPIEQVPVQAAPQAAGAERPTETVVASPYASLPEGQFKAEGKWWFKKGDRLMVHEGGGWI